MVGAVPVAGVGGALAFDAEGLQAAAGDEVAFFIGEIAIEQAVGTVFGFVHDAGAGIDGDGFVAKAAHFFQGDGFDQFR